MAFILSPSLLSADFANLQQAIELIDNTEADWFHIDVMDGLFVPNITIGQPVVKAIKKHARKPLDVHLMIVDPDRYIKGFKDAGADILTVHEEACRHLNRTLGNIREEGMKAGVSINPHTPVSMLENVIEYADLVLIMSVNPGFGGQKFIENSYRKIEELNRLKQKYNPELIIEVDGGVSLENAPRLLAAGANALVAGNAVFSAPDVPQRIADFKKL
ncbi:MAG: ribulose-phosphate 3-epimerase [Bacteroides sp.]|nr:ribulose-phosphate 3-epimerase [Ruminococcus flavefaciens]MCM1555318.1 ribulose-phosphate 3-epimerase [Bacteroides sp.]